MRNKDNITARIAEARQELERLSGIKRVLREKLTAALSANNLDAELINGLQKDIDSVAHRRSMMKSRVDALEAQMPKAAAADAAAHIEEMRQQALAHLADGEHLKKTTEGQWRAAMGLLRKLHDHRQAYLELRDEIAYVALSHGIDIAELNQFPWPVLDDSALDRRPGQTVFSAKLRDLRRKLDRERSQALKAARRASSPQQSAWPALRMS